MTLPASGTTSVSLKDSKRTTRKCFHRISTFMAFLWNWTTLTSDHCHSIGTDSTILSEPKRRGRFEVPEQLRDRPGKLIYLSLGSMGGADVELMKRLVGFLAESRNRFIVSKGPLHDRYELTDNMWGQQSVDQIQVLPAVDLFITHGGNNSLTEAFYFGKPMIVMPLFGDQHDNGQRLVEKGLGLKLNPHKCNKEELLSGIETLLKDKELNDKLRIISKRIQSENSIAKLTKLIEDLVFKQNKFCY